MTYGVKLYLLSIQGKDLKEVRTNSTPKMKKKLKSRITSKKSTKKIFPELKPFPIVGIGASAGGLEAVIQLLNHLPIDTGMGFVLVQHLDPSHESLAAEIYSRATRMKVTEVKESIQVQPNHVYIIPPNFSMGILNGVLNLVQRTETGGVPLVIDFFLHTLANDQKNRAVGVILSGMGSDGTPGLMAIKAEGGITFAQNPKTAKFDGMPQNAITSGAVDLVLSPQQIAEELARIAHHPYIVPKPQHPNSEHGNEPANEPESEDDRPLSRQKNLNHIFLLLRNQCHVDFTHYKSNTIRRRIDRRIVLNKIKDESSYAKFLSNNSNEVKALYADLLINVTSFFRDPDAFEALKQSVFPTLMDKRFPGTPIRVWSIGCSTGEEAYSIAISLLEFLGEKASEIPIQIFGSDISEQAIQKARLGEYPETITREISPERLNRYFTKLEGGGYKIAKSIRDICIFSRHDVTRDPPFAKIDLISCRNLLIYFTAILQKHAFPIFHYALCPKGFLWLGKSETIGGFSDLFSTADKANNLYSKKNVPNTLNLRLPSSTYVPERPGITSEIERKPTPFMKVIVDAEKIIEKAIQEQFPGVLVNEEMEILQFRGRTSPFINPAPGLPHFNLIKMANPEILSDLRMCIQAARKKRAPVKKEGLSIQEHLILRVFNLRVIPIKPTSATLNKEYYYLVQFEDIVETNQKKARESSAKSKTVSTNTRLADTTLEKKDSYIAELQQELLSYQEYQQSLIEKSATTQENLTAANEELQSANEELQSTNEELETAKEELQSGNEELITVNEELRNRNLEQIQTNNDLTNLLASVQIPIVMLGSDQRIRRFTPLAGKALNLIQADIGRPLSDLKVNFTTNGVGLNLEQMISEVADSMEPREVEVQDRHGRWFRLQARPYKTSEGRIDGAVLALVDIDALINSLTQLKAANTEVERANRAKDLFIATLSHELRTPLTAILSWAEMLVTGKLDTNKVIYAGEVIRDCGNAQVALINDLLDVSRIILGKLSLQMRDVHPEVIISKAIESVRSTANKKSIHIETAFDSQAGTVVADPSKLQQVFLNLLTNAVKFSSPNSKVLVRLEKVKDHEGQKAKVMIKVVDSGKGITPEFLPHVFDSFSQADCSSIRVHGGLGLGLAIARNLVELHGGNIKAESPGEAGGSTFTITLPKTPDSKLSEDQDRQKDWENYYLEMSRIRLDKLRVLIVEDEMGAQEAFMEMLQTFGAIVKVASSVKEAFEIFQKEPPDVLVSDIAMPGEDGYSLIRKIRALRPEQGGNTPAIALTAYGGAEDMQKALTAGFQYRVAKPIDSVDLANLVAKAATEK